MYIRELASDFNKFYANYKVITNNEIWQDALDIVKAYKNVFRICANLLGIDPLEKM